MTKTNDGRWQSIPGITDTTNGTDGGTWEIMKYGKPGDRPERDLVREIENRLEIIEANKKAIRVLLDELVGRKGVGCGSDL